MARNDGLGFYKPKGDDLGFWVVVGVFITLWGVSELLGDMYWWASGQFLWGIYLLGVGSAIIMKTLLKMKVLE